MVRERGSLILLDIKWNSLTERERGRGEGREKKERDKERCHTGENRRKSVVVALSMAIVFRLGSAGNKIGNLQIFTCIMKFLYCRRLSENTGANATLNSARLSWMHLGSCFIREGKKRIVSWLQFSKC